MHTYWEEGTWIQAHGDGHPTRLRTNRTTAIKESRIYLVDIGGQRSLHPTSEYDQVLLEDKEQVHENFFLASSSSNFGGIVPPEQNCLADPISEQDQCVQEEDTKYTSGALLPKLLGGKDINKAAKYILCQFMQANKAMLSVYPELDFHRALGTGYHYIYVETGLSHSQRDDTTKHIEGVGENLSTGVHGGHLMTKFLNILCMLPAGHGEFCVCVCIRAFGAFALNQHAGALLGMHGKKCTAAFDAFALYDYFCPTTMKLPNGECTLTFVVITLLKYSFLFKLICTYIYEKSENKASSGILGNLEERMVKLGPDFREDEWQEWFRAREEDNVKKKHKAISEPKIADNLLQDGSAKANGHPAKHAQNKKT
ncbi:hypothetical protein IW261DRAFT_1598447 [Armillaria novae-zelandiae]|uniref:Uncharacterized protein n=1 Tax=Armillaria novae-zelandiae TaxID=153914 RepID=A0AA39TY33_9AGAR|nr:hypothetical protein IW261DRAFT_1598447 [Armillaria novae-zelandiae]